MNPTQQRAVSLAADALKRATQTRAVDGHDEEALGILMSGFGALAWAPGRDPKINWSKWGAWEAWAFCKEGDLPDGRVGLIPTGDWIAWDSATGAQLGFKTRYLAEGWALYMNEGKRTRIVDPLRGGFSESRLKYDEIAAKMRPLIAAAAAQIQDNGG